MRISMLLLPIILFIVRISVLYGNIIHVPADQPTIQAGINAAVDGDTVMVSNGTYTGPGNYDINFLGKAIVLMSVNGPAVTTIDCEGDSLNPHRGFYFHSEEDTNSVVQGFAIINGYANGSGGAIYSWNSSPTILGNVIIGNTANGAGGAIYCYDSSSPIIEDNKIVRNVSSSHGGGIYCTTNSAPTIEGNIIAGNVAFSNGGGISCVNSSPIIMRNTIVGDTATNNGGGIYSYNCSSSIIDSNEIGWNTADDGGGIYCYTSSPSIEGNTIMRNTVSGNGGGIYCYDGSDPFIWDNTIVGNTAESRGGGMYCYSSSSILEENTIINNAAGDQGGGLWCSGSELTIRKNIITGNTVTNAGGGIYCSGGGPIILNTTVAGNWATDGGGIYCINSSPTVLNSILWGNIYLQGGTPTITYTDIEGGWPGVGNIDADPLFVLLEKRDCRLLWGSPCIDTGHPDSLDADGTRSDMGAHYFNQLDYLTLYVTPDTTEVPPGGQLGVTYTAINRWNQPKPFWLLSQVLLPWGGAVDVMGPEQFTLPANYTIQVQVNHAVPMVTPTGVYEYWSRIGIPPATLYDEDSFKFWVVP